MKKQNKLLLMVILIMVTSLFIGLPANSINYGESESFKPLLLKESVAVYNHTFLYDDGSMISGSYSLMPLNKFDRNSIVLNKNLDVIHKVPDNVSFQCYSNKKILNAWLTSNYYGSPVVYQIDGKLVTMPYTGDIFIDYGLAVVGINGKNKVYNLENGNLVVSFDKTYVYDKVIPISKDYLLVSNKNKYNIYDYSGIKLFPDLDDIGIVGKMRNGILITKDALINTKAFIPFINYSFKPLLFYTGVVYYINYF